MMDILRDKMGISNMDQSKKLVIPKEVPMNGPETDLYLRTLKQLEAQSSAGYRQQMPILQPILQTRAGDTVEPRVNPSEYDLNTLIAEQARLSLCKDVAEAKLKQAKQAESDAAFACEQHMNLIKAVIGATVENIKKVLK
jgi:hypothetical protein